MIIRSFAVSERTASIQYSALYVHPANTNDVWQSCNVFSFSLCHIPVTNGVILCCQAHLKDDGSVASLVYEISCPAPQYQPDLLPAFLAELPSHNAEPGQSCASPFAAEYAA